MARGDRRAGEGDSRSGLDRVIVALDTDDRETFRRWCALFGPRVGALKVGLEAFARWGPAAAEEARDRSRGLFLDLKLHDIPNTVAGAVRAAAALGADLVTVHTAAGERSLSAAVDAGGERTGILGVTLLTHLSTAELGAVGLAADATELVAARARLARAAGCSGVVCSPLELSALRDSHPADFLLVTPGIRPRGSVADDQRRVATPGRALADGADLLVIGRPLTAAADPERALAELESELAER